MGCLSFHGVIGPDREVFSMLERICSYARGLAASLPRGVGRGAMLALGALALVALSVGTAAATDPTWTSVADYAGFGVTVAILFPLVVSVLQTVLLPMIVMSLCVAVTYFLWS